MDHVAIGIDVSKSALEIAVQPSGDHWTSESTPAAVDALVARLTTRRPQVIVVEATGGYEGALVAACAAADLPVAVINLRQVRAFAQALGHTAKTEDRCAGPRRVWPRAPATGAIARDLRNHIRWLARRVADVDDEIGGAIEQSAVWRVDEDLLRRVPGIGPVTARTLLAALVATRHNPVLARFYQRLCAAGKRPTVALIATVRKLLTILNAMLKHQRPWTPAISA